MAIVNRELAPSMQMETIPIRLKAVTTAGGTHLAALIPMQCEVKAVRMAGLGLSGSPSIELEAYKFSGGVTINSALSTALAVTAVGTSGLQALVLGTAGSTQVLLDANSYLIATCSGANSAVDQLVMEVVVQRTQDIVSRFGV